MEVKFSINTKEVIFYDINNHILYDKKPSEYLSQISNTPIFSEFPFNMLLRLKTTDQHREHHPEGNVWNHTLLVVDEAVKHRNKSTDDKMFMWAALLHDIGKPDTTRVRKGKITAYDHDKVGADLTIKFLSEFNLSKDFIIGVSALVRWHMQILFVVNDLPFADIKTMKEQVDINDTALLGLCDRLGRGKVNIKKEMGNIDIFLSKM